MPIPLRTKMFDSTDDRDRALSDSDEGCIASCGALSSTVVSDSIVRVEERFLMAASVPNILMVDDPDRLT